METCFRRQAKYNTWSRVRPVPLLVCHAIKLDRRVHLNGQKMVPSQAHFPVEEARGWEKRHIMRKNNVSHLPFVFIVGMNKTATTSLHHFFEGHDWPSVHYDRGRLAETMLRNALRGTRVLKGYDHRFRVFADMVVNTSELRFEANTLFPALHRDYPGAYFILNTRDEDAWVASRLANFSMRTKMKFVDLECRVSGLKTAEEAIAKWRSDRREFENRVERYFEGSPRFLKIDIERDDVPRQLEKLLGVDFDPSKWMQIKTNQHFAPAHLT